MDIKVPVFSSEWFGTGTVIVEASSLFCITTWLPLWRTSTKPCLARITQTSRPESTRSLTNLDLKSRHKHFGVSPPLDLGWIRRLEKELDRLLQVRTSALDGVTLARNVELGTKSNVCIALALNDCRKLLRTFHWVTLASF
jgi:hypothetical protein